MDFFQFRQSWTISSDSAVTPPIPILIPYLSPAGWGLRAFDSQGSGNITRFWWYQNSTSFPILSRNRSCFCQDVSWSGCSRSMLWYTGSMHRKQMMWCVIGACQLKKMLHTTYWNISSERQWCLQVQTPREMLPILNWQQPSQRNLGSCKIDGTHNVDFIKWWMHELINQSTIKNT